MGQRQIVRVGSSGAIRVWQYLRSTILSLAPRLGGCEVIFLRRVRPLAAGIKIRKWLRLGAQGQPIGLCWFDHGGGGAIYAAVRMRLAIMGDGVLIRRRGRPGEGSRRIELGCVLIKILELVAGVVVEGILSKRCVSHMSPQHEALVMWAAEGEGQDDSRKSGLERAASCISTWETANDCFWGLTGGEVVLKSSEPAELECEGVRGGMLMGNW